MGTHTSLRPVRSSRWWPSWTSAWPGGAGGGTAGLRDDLLGAADPAERSEVRAAVLRFVAMGLISVGLVAVPTVWVMHDIARDNALEGAVLMANNLARRTVAPLVTPALEARDPAALEAIDAVVHPRMSDGSVRRIKVWDSTGRILYSDEAPLIGRRFELPDWAPALIAGGAPEAELTQPDKQENLFERADGQLVEVYTSARDTLGRPLIFEAYFPATAVTGEEHDLLVRLLPVGVVALVALHVTQLPPALLLARRFQRTQRAKARLLAQAAAASEMERRRLARDLHDDVIQDLAGVSYALESVLQEGGPESPLLRQVQGIVRRDVGLLRGMLTDLYPVDPSAVGLPDAFAELVAPMERAGVAVSVDVDPAPDLDATSAVLLYRVAREALANAAKHAGATAVSLRLERLAHEVVLSVVDDGRGFDTRREQESGHLGLRLVRDTVAEAGGMVRLESRPGHGTRLEMRLQTS
ncbi:sensor histidine kinase [Oryzihumus sp.]